MQVSTQKQLFNEINSYYRSNATKLAPQETRQRASIYFDPARHAQERALLRRLPQIVAHASSVPKPGDFIALDHVGAPILIARQRNGTLKAFLNICTHRGAKVCNEPCGNKAAFSCPYHAWTFRNDGQLLAAPREAFPKLDVAGTGLSELPVEERHGLIWVIATPGLTIDVKNFLGPLDAELASYGIGDYTPVRAETLTPALNWKFVLDGFLEVYHFPRLHANSIAPWFYGKYSTFDTLGVHGRLVGVRKSFDAIAGKPFENIEFLPNVAVNYQLFPNTICVWQGDHFEIWTSYPGQTPGSCIAQVLMLAPHTMATSEHRPRWDRNWNIIEQTVIGEDWAISENVQSTLPFIPNDEVIFGANEPGLQHFHQTIEAAVHA